MINGRVGRIVTSARVRRIEPRGSGVNKAVVPPYRALLDNAPVNVLFADRDLVIRYLNPASIAALRTIAHLLPVPVEAVVGSPVDLLHELREHQRQVLTDPSLLPYRELITLGNETVEVLASAIHDADDEYLGAMLTWSVAPAADAPEAIDPDADGGMTALTGAGEATPGAPGDAIDDPIGWVTDIARRTKLVAVDAAREAARAGETGKGLARVANVVRQLAQETVHATDEIRRNLGSEPDRELVADAIQLVGVIVGQMHQIQSTIASGVERQTATANAIARDVADAAQRSDQIAQGVVRVVEAARSNHAGAVRSLH